MSDNWITDAMFYHIYPIGFTGAPKKNKGEETAGHRILDMIEWIPHFKEIGVNSIYLGPIFESGSHGYDTTDYYKIDSRLGTNEDFKRVMEELHSNGFHVILDGVFNHVGRDFFAFKEVQKNLRNSEYCDWFCNLNFEWQSPLGDPFAYETWHGAAELVKLNLRNEKVCEYLMGAVHMWMEEFGIDGLRLDAADCIERDFFKRLRYETKSRREDFWLMGEIIHGDYNMWANGEMLDSVTNYECWKGIYSSHNDRNYFEIAYALNRQSGEYGIYKNLRLYNFLDNHDVNRIGSLLKQKENIYNAYTLLYAMPGIPSVYYGSEWGIEGEKGQGMDADLPLRPQLCLRDMQKENPKLIAHIKKLSEIRSASNALKVGDYEQVLVKNEQLVFARNYESETVLAAFNLTEKEITLSFRYKDRDYEVALKEYESKIITA